MSKSAATTSSDGSRLPLAIGATVRGIRFQYEIVSELGKGGRGHAFIVKATESTSGRDAPPGGECVLKTVRIDDRRSADEIFSFAAHVHGMLIREFRALRRLRTLPCVPEVFDFGQFGFILEGRSSQDKSETVPLSFIVRELAEGLPLDVFLENNFARKRGDKPPHDEPTSSQAPIDSEETARIAFSGIPCPDPWFSLARDLATALLQIQQREVVHRDIWYKNILVHNSAIRFIDFGDAYFRQEVATEISNERSDSFVAPEIRAGSRWPSRRADIYSMGGVLFYMATGTWPPNPPIADDDRLKRVVTDKILEVNATLLHANHGVADIIARCLRSDHHKRIRDAELLLEDLRMFNNSAERLTLRGVFERITTQVHAGDDGDMPGLFNEIAAIELNHLSNVLEGMKLGSVDINGDHEQLASALAHYLSVLQSGDEYLAVSTADFWAPDNAGINGRVLSMNRILAQRGVVIRRLFLVAHDELDDPTSLFWSVAKEHLAKSNEIKHDVRWETFIKIVDAAVKSDAIDFFRHYGVWIKNGQAVRLLPVYTRHGKDKRALRALRIRKYDGDVQIVRQTFDQLVQDHDVHRLDEFATSWFGSIPRNG